MKSNKKLTIYSQIQHFFHFILLERKMHLLKNFGSGGSSSVSKAGAVTGATTGAKPSYFSSLNLASQGQKQKKKQKCVKKKQGPPKEFIPQKFGLDFDTPAIILQYRDTQTSKLYHHKMSIKKLKKDTPSKLVLDYLRKRHSHYFAPKVIDQIQIQKLVDRLKNGLIEGLDDVDQEDFQFDYDQDDD